MNSSKISAKASSSSKKKSSSTKQNTNKMNNTIYSVPIAQNRGSKQNGSNHQPYRECERVRTIPGSVAFGVVANVPMNPGIATSFPWLSGHAVLFEKYIVKKLIYRYKNIKGTTTDGNILMSFDYDTLDPEPTTAIEVTQSTVYQDGAPWRIFEMRVPCDPKREYFTRSQGVGNADLKTYDMGRLFVSAEGCANTTDHGILEVEYEIELFDKQTGLSSSINRIGSFSYWNLSSDQTVASTTATVAFDEAPLTNTFTVINTAGAMTVPYACTLRVDVTLSASSLHFSSVVLEKNSAAFAVPILFGPVTGTATAVTGFAIVSLTAGDIIRVRVTSGSTLVLETDACRLGLTVISSEY
jgi:hypothetical protein